MSIELSEQAWRKLSTMIGSSDPAAVARLIERLADNEHIVRALIDAPTVPDEDPRGTLTESQLRENVATMKRGEADICAGKGTDMATSIREIAAKHGLDIR